MNKRSFSFNLFQLIHKKSVNFDKFFAFVILSFFIGSCSTEVEIEWKDDSQKYVVNCLLTPDEPVKLYAFKTSPILDDTSFFADGLDIEIYKNETLAWSGSGTGQGEYPVPVYAEAGAKFKIIMKDKNGFNVSAEDTLPEKVKITDATNLYPVYSDNYGTTYGKITLTFTDEANKRNYYEIVILNENNGIVQTLKVKNPVITYDIDHNPNPTGTLLFTDELFEGKPLTLEIFSDSYKPSVVLKNVSRNYYEYRKSINIHFYNQNVERYDVFSMFKGDPVELYSNVSNGLGIFAGYTQDIKECTLIKN